MTNLTIYFIIVPFLALLLLFLNFILSPHSPYEAKLSPAMCFGKTLLRVLLSNSGDPLKLMIPNDSQKAISGWTNYSGMVISHKMSENKMGNRGSKSDVIKTSVKEQRVDGSRCKLSFFKSLHLRYTLLGFERNYQIKNPSKQLNKSYYSTIINKQNLFNNTNISLFTLNPWWITGFADAEGSFIISIRQDNKRKLKW